MNARSSVSVHKIRRFGWFSHRLSTIGLGLLLAGCAAAPAATQAPNPPPVETQAIPTLTLGDVTYPSPVRLGDTFELTVPVTNSGSSQVPRVSFQGFSKADLTGCVPICKVGKMFDPYGEFPALAAGQQAIYQVGFVATKLGSMDVSVCVASDTSRSQCVSGSLVVAG